MLVFLTLYQVGTSRKMSSRRWDGASSIAITHHPYYRMYVRENRVLMQTISVKVFGWSTVSPKSWSRQLDVARRRLIPNWCRY